MAKTLTHKPSNRLGFKAFTTVKEVTKNPQGHRQDQQGKQRPSDDAADNHAGKWALGFATNALRDGGRHQTQPSHQRRHQNRSQT